MRLLFAVVLLASGCAAQPPPAMPRSTEFLPEITGEAARKAHVLYQDGALAALVPGGTLWLFGDTFTGTRGPDGKPAFTGALSNTMALLPAGARGQGWPPRLEYLAGKDGLAAAPLALLPGEDEKTRRLWPLAAVWMEDRGRGYMFYGLIDVTGPGPWGFKGVGTGLARAEKAFGPYERLPQGAGWPIDPSSVVRRDGYLYLYAPRRFKGEQDLSSGLLIARVREREIEDPARYEFFAGRGAKGEARWAARVEDASAAAEDVWGQASVAWNTYLGSYLLATSSNIFRHDQIQLRRGPTPLGPWTALEPGDGFIPVPEREGEETQLIYCTMLHPELDEDGGRVITLTFCRMLKREWALTNPEGVRVQLSGK